MVPQITRILQVPKSRIYSDSQFLREINFYQSRVHNMLGKIGRKIPNFQCGNYNEILLTHFFDKKFRENNSSWFHEFFLQWEWISRFSTLCCTNWFFPFFSNPSLFTLLLNQHVVFYEWRVYTVFTFRASYYTSGILYHFLVSNSTS